MNFLAHGKKDNYCLHETTVESMFKLLIYINCYNTCAFMLKYIFIHSFILMNYSKANFWGPDASFHTHIDILVYGRDIKY